ncbi:MAG: M15 family metallopeptidase [Selenomonadaceae bacterium]|nr:M15 family metallopeptidase [Selenomonadaceae bacterium]
MTNKFSSLSQFDETLIHRNNKDFYIAKIDEALFRRINGKSYKPYCTLPTEDLRYLHLLYKDIDGFEHEGEMICNAYIVADLIDIFQKLYKNNYPIEKIRLIDEYNADDETSMRDNNSSCFNFRYISHTTKISKHGLGLAVDINPLYNPYVKCVDGKQIIEPATAKKYLDRTKDFPYKTDKNSLVYKLFAAHGFEWGGDWETRKDYQHFELPTAVIETLYKENK